MPRTEFCFIFHLWIFHELFLFSRTQRLSSTWINISFSHYGYDVAVEIFLVVTRTMRLMYMYKHLTLGLWYVYKLGILYIFRVYMNIWIRRNVIIIIIIILYYFRSTFYLRVVKPRRRGRYLYCGWLFVFLTMYFTSVFYIFGFPNLNVHISYFVKIQHIYIYYLKLESTYFFISISIQIAVSFFIISYVYRYLGVVWVTCILSMVGDDPRFRP